MAPSTRAVSCWATRFIPCPRRLRLGIQGGCVRNRLNLLGAVADAGAKQDSPAEEAVRGRAARTRKCSPTLVFV